MKRKNLLALTAFLIFAGVALYIIMTDSDSNQTLNLEEAKFSVKDTSAIDSIFIARKDGSTALLTRFAATRWMVNKKTLVDPVLVNILLRTIHDIDVRRPINTAEREQVIKGIATQHIKIEIYAKGELVKSYYIGQEADDNQGNYILTTGSEQPYVAHIPGFEGILAPRYDVREKTWRDRQIFITSPLKLSSVRVTYPSNPEGSFQILFNKGQFSFPDIPNPDTASAEQFLQNISKAYLERYIGDLKQSEADSMLKLKPYMIITMKNIGETEGETMTVMPPKNLSNTYVYMNKTQEWGIYQLPLLDKLSATKKDFVAKPKTK